MVCRIQRLTALIIFAIMAAGCAEKTIPLSMDGSAPAPQINRIISAAPAYTEIIAALGLADKLVAVDKYSRNVPGVGNELPEIDFFYPDMEAIAGLKPDIIISGEINTAGSESPYRFFRQMGINVMEIETSNSIEEIYRDIILIAEALEENKKGRELAGGMMEKIKSISERAAANGVKKSVYFEIEAAPNIISFGAGTYLNEMIEAIGARNIFADEKRWFTPGAEAVINANPDVIFFLGGSGGAEEIKNRPGFKSINAVRQNKIFAINADNASRPSPNIVLALEEMYRAVYSN
jgi:iron complex transport system substrate-binding protein